MKSLKFMLYTRENIVWELSHRGKEFVDEWFDFWFGDATVDKASKEAQKQ